MKVFDFAAEKKARDPHVSGGLYCMACNHEWVGVWSPGQTEFQCPECKSMKGRNKYEVSPGEGMMVWQCVACENQLFNLLPDRVHCPGCGKQWDYGELVDG